MPPMSDDAIRLRVIFLLRRCGPCRACELAEFIGIPTCDMQATLAGMRSQAVVEKFPEGTTEKWVLLSTLAAGSLPSGVGPSVPDAP